MNVPTYSKSPPPKARDDRIIQQIYENLIDNETPLVIGAVVECGSRTRQKFGLQAEDYVHFRKTYHPGAGGNPEDEYRRSMEVWAAIPEGAAKPLGFEGKEFHARLIKGTAWAALSPFGTSMNYCPAAGTPTPIAPEAAEQYWDGLEKLHTLFGQLHKTHSHGDVHRNQVLMVVGTDGAFEPKLIDFEDAAPLAGLTNAERRETIADDLVDLMLEAKLLQEHILGPRNSPLGLASRGQVVQGIDI